LNTLFLDFETYYSTANGYTLKEISMFEYIRSPKFKVFGCGLKWAGGETIWVSGDRACREYFDAIDWSDTQICAQNVKFDGAILRWIYGINPARYLDTLSMSRAIIGCRLPSHSLASVSAYFGLAPKGFLKTDGLAELTPEQEKELASYCLHDVELCEEIYNRVSPGFPEAEYKVLDWTIRCFIEPKLVLDGALLADLNVKERERRANIFKEIGLPKEVFASNVKFPALLAERGYEVPMKKSPKRKDADGNALMIPALSISDTGFIELQNTDNPELEALCEARIAAKSTLLETRSAKFLEISKIGTFPFDLNYSGAVNTHRFSGASGAGGNPQNLPRGSALRGAVCASSGSKLVVADFAAIELRVVAWLAREPKLIEVLLDRKGDPYSHFATKIYQRSITKADKAERQYGKCAILGLGYQMGAKKFIFQTRSQTGMIIEQEESERVVGLYRGTFTRIPGLWETLDHYIPYIAEKSNVKLPGVPFLEIKNGCVYLPSGLRLQYPNLRKDGFFGKGHYKRDEWAFDTKGGKSKLYGGKLLENISQALAGELCKLAISRAIYNGVQCVGQVHDEVLAVAPDRDAQWTLNTLVEAMETPVPWWPMVKLYAEGGIGQSWLEAKP